MINKIFGDDHVIVFHLYKNQTMFIYVSVAFAGSATISQVVRRGPCYDYDCHVENIKRNNIY